MTKSLSGNNMFNGVFDMDVALLDTIFAVL